MKLFFGTRTAWAGDLVYSIVELCGDVYFTEIQSPQSTTVYNFNNVLTMAAEGILEKEGGRNYRYTIENYFHSLFRQRQDPNTQFWVYGQFILKGRIPFGKTGFFTVNLSAHGAGRKRSLTLEVGVSGHLMVERGGSLVSKFATWKQDLLAAWLAKWQWECLRLPVADGERVMCLGELLASELYYNCGDEAGRNATLDAVEDRGKQWQE